uniref:CRAL-TRIO domain-containing protein n=1 Tax=Amphora coffeiformis TaxID=265554 RepID=A0A7S3L0N6_9STRA|eukprot:scaffold620_cov169-Amphora_coffeaeformis.AAC.24
MATSDVTQGLTADVYGQLHPVETDEMIAQKLKQFEEELEKLPQDQKHGLQQAQEKCPAELTNEFKLMFLRSEVFNADLAAKRYAHYWDKRVEICGPEKAFLPLTLDGALRDDEVALKIGFVNYLAGCSDPHGRAILYVLPGNQDKTKYTRESMGRAVWYVIHAALEEMPEAQKHGIIFMAHPAGAKLAQFDRAMMKVVLSAIQGTLPVRLSAFHICQPVRKYLRSYTCLEKATLLMMCGTN